jgi:hypothetical protein
MAGATKFQGSDMSPIIRRLRRLEDRFGTVETEHTRQLLAQLEAGRRRVAEWRAREGLPPEEPDKEDLSGLTIVEILHWGRERAHQAAIAEEAADRYR